MTEKAVVVEDLAHRYPSPRRGGSPVPALRGISFSVEEGILFGVLGPNGGGKSTLFRILSTAQTPTSGRASVGGHDVVRSPARVRERIGVVFQSPGLDKKLTVEENVIHQGRLYGLWGAELRRRTVEQLGRLGLSDRSRDIVETLSGGLQRRLEIAKGLIHHPSVLLLDEPTTGLDPASRRDVWTYLAGLTRQGVTALVTTHLIEEADRCGRIAILDKGVVAEIGAPGELKAKIRGDVVTVETADPARMARDIASTFGRKADVVDNAVRIEHPEGHRFVPQLVESFPGSVLSVHVGKPTLEDVFVQRTGHRFWAEGDRA